MDLSVIIVNYNQKYFPKMCVNALEQSKTKYKFEIIVVDNNSHDESMEFLKQAAKKKRIKLLSLKKNYGYGVANNRGSKTAKGKYLLFLNPDVFVKEDTIQKLIDYAKKNKKTGIVGPKLLYHNGEIQASCRRLMSFTDLIIKRTFLKRFFPERIKKYLMQDYKHDQKREVDLLVGAAMLMPRQVYQKVKGFDPRYFLFMEDFDLCRKVSAAGFKVTYYPLAEAVHFHKRLSGGSLFTLLFKQVFWHHIISACKYFWKWRKAE